MKERLMVKKLQEFLENNYYPIAILSGIRKIGKTTILLQLEAKYHKSKYIDCSLNAYKSTGVIIDALKNKEIELILIDEFTHVPEFEELAVQIYNTLARQVDILKKVIITASSPIHLTRLNTFKLGGGRSLLFKLPPITFVEYLYFSNKISSYSDIDNVKNEWFLDYLRRDMLPNGLILNFDDYYLQNEEDIILLSNETARVYTSDVDIKHNDLKIIRDLIAYKISDYLKYNKFLHPKIGYQEFRVLKEFNEIKDITEVNLLDTSISFASTNITNIKFIDRIRIIRYMLESGMAFIVRKNDLTDNTPTVDEILKTIKTANRYEQFKNIEDYFSIHLTNLYWYMYLCEEIFKAFSKDLTDLRESELIGKLVELYLSGSLYYKSNSKIYINDKLVSDEIGEVDIYDSSFNILIESTISDKNIKNINLNKYGDHNSIKILSTKTINDNVNGYYRIPYAKLLCMLDTDDIFKLKK